MSPLTEPTKLTLAKTYVGIDDPDAANYIALVEAADTAAGSPGGLETATKVAIHSFVKGCKADGIWPAIKASCILAGARTLAGALVPLVGTAPTNNNFVSGDYNRETGLVGDGSTKHLDSNRASSADPLNSNHLAVYATTVGSGDRFYIGVGLADTNSHHFASAAAAPTRILSRSRSATVRDVSNQNLAGFIGISRNNAVDYTQRGGGQTVTFATASNSASSANTQVFRSDTGFNTNARLAFYSIGESLNLALLDARVTDLINAFGAAIP